MRISQKQNTSFEGKTIEEELRQMIETGENPEQIPRVHEPIYTERKEGVRPENNIRTDKWEIAQAAMETANAAKKEKGNAKSAKKRGEEAAKNEGQGVDTKSKEKGAETAATAEK